MALSVVINSIEEAFSVSGTVKSIAPNTVMWLLILLAINIGIMLLKFFLDWRHGKNDIHNYKRKKISETSIEVESEIYKKLLELTIFQKAEYHEMLDRIQELDDYIERNSLYIGKKYRGRVDETLDYFKEVVTCYGKKDNKKEGEFFKKLSKSFYGE
jgi:hypothetical protein